VTLPLLVFFQDVLMIPYGERWLEAALVKLPTSSGTKSMIFHPIGVEFWRIPLNDMSQESRRIVQPKISINGTMSMSYVHFISGPHYIRLAILRVK
jgi:hypothetical protein